MGQQEFVWDEESAIEFARYWFRNSDTDKKEAIAAFKKTKQPKPLFTTTDGKEIFNGDYFYTASREESAQKRMATLDGPVYEHAFSTRLVANEFFAKQNAGNVRFEEVVEPVIKWLNDNGNPHSLIIISNERADLLYGIESHGTDKYLKD